MSSFELGDLVCRCGSPLVWRVVGFCGDVLVLESVDSRLSFCIRTEAAVFEVVRFSDGS